MKYLSEKFPTHSDKEEGIHSVSNKYLVSKYLYSKKSKYQQIDIIENPYYGRCLFLDDLMMTTEKDEFVYHECLTHVPISKVKDPKKVLVIGGGDGGIVRELCKYKSIEKIDLVEIDKMVKELSCEYLPSISCSFNDPRVHCHFTDGAKFVEACEDKYYDLILVDSSDPVGPGIVLFEDKFYSECKRISKQNAQFCAQGLGVFLEPKIQKYMFNNLKKVYSNVAPYYAVIPTYPTSLWLFFQASNNPIDKECNYNNLPKGLKYINKNLLKSIYDVPQIALDNLN